MICIKNLKHLTTNTLFVYISLFVLLVSENLDSILSKMCELDLPSVHLMGLYDVLI